MATESYQTQLERVQTTIAAIENGEREVRRGDRVFTDVDLPGLHRREAKLRRYVDREAGNIGRRVVPK